MNRPFDEPIPLPRGRQLITLEDAGRYITRLPKAEHEAAEWQTAMEALILVATLGGPTMFARIGVMRALNRNIERVLDPSRKDHHWGKRKLAAGYAKITRIGLGATALNYLEVPSPIQRRPSRNSKSKRGIHKVGSGRQVIAADNCRRRDWPK